MPSLTKVQTSFLDPQGALELIPGTASAPGLRFSTSSTTGMFSPSAGVLGFSTGSTQNALTILGGGNVGIGTTNPIQKLDVRGNIYNISPNWIGHSDFTHLKFSDNFVELRATSTSVDGVSLLVDGSTRDLLARVFTNGIFVNNKIWHAGNDGVGSGLDADLLDGLSSGSFVRTDVSSTISSPSTLSFGSGTRQMLNLWSTIYGLGVQTSTLYYRSDSRFSWHRGGSHNDNENNPGGGTVAMTLDGSSNLAVTGTVTGSSIIRSGGTSSQFLKADGSVDSNTYITSASVGNGTLTLNVSGTGLSGSQTFTANQSGNATFTVTSNATSANTASTIVARDSSGNFSAGTITAVTEVLSGNLSAWSATTPGRGVGGLHLGTASGTSNVGSAITFGARDSDSGTTGQAGIYINSDGTYGTRMYFATTDSYAVGSKVAMSISETGVVNFLRGTPTSGGNTIWHSGNDGAGSGLDADLLDGENLVDNANTANTIVGRNASGNIFANQFIGGNGSAIGSAGLVVNGTVGDNDSQLILKKPSQSSFGVLAWDGMVFLSSNIYYENGSWIHNGPSGNNNNQLFTLEPGAGVRWYASNTGTGSFNVNGGNILWNDSGVWQRPLSNTLTLNTSGTGLSGSTTFNNSGAATFTVTSNATSANTASTIVARDASGNFSASTITAALSGNASTATNLSNSGTVTLATATESNAITITQPSYTSDQPVKLLNFDWYGNTWSLGNIRSGSTPSNGLGIYSSGTERARFTTSGLNITGTISASAITAGTSISLDPSNITGFGAGQVTESSTGFSAPGIIIGNGSGSHGAIVYGSGLMYFGSETGSDNTMQTRMTLSNGGVCSATADFRSPIFYDSNDTGFFIDPNSTSTSIQVAGTIEQGNNYAHPNIEWSSTGATGEVIFYLPGTTANYGMVHMVFDIYEYNSPRLCTVIIGGHNWSTQWYNIACNVVGYTDKTIRLGVKNNRYCVVFGGTSSYWSYGQIRLRKIQNGSYYNNVMDLGGNWSTEFTTTESFSYITGDLRGLRTPSTFEADGIIYGYSDIRTPLLYDSNNTAYYVDPASTSYLNLVRCNNWLYLDQNFGHSIVGVYSAVRYQGVFAMGDAYKLPADGTNTGSLYGIAWSHPNAGGIAGNLNTHGALILENGNYLAALSGSIRCRDDMRTQIYYDSNDTGYYMDPASYCSFFRGQFRSYAGSTSNGNQVSLELQNAGGTGDGNVAAMSFHCSGWYGMHMHLRADSYFGIGGWSASTWRWYVQMSTGDMTAAGNVTAYSDIRLKEEIAPLENSLDKLMTLNGVSFRWKDLPDIVGNPGKKDFGIIAQEVEKVFPEVIHESAHESPDGDKYKTVAYDKLVPVLIEAIKQQQKDINNLKQQIKELKTL